jgi:hypothetical protein
VAKEVPKSGTLLEAYLLSLFVYSFQAKKVLKDFKERVWQGKCLEAVRYWRQHVEQCKAAVVTSDERFHRTVMNLKRWVVTTWRESAKWYSEKRFSQWSDHGCILRTRCNTRVLHLRAARWV